MNPIKSRKQYKSISYGKGAKRIYFCDIFGFT